MRQPDWIKSGKYFLDHTTGKWRVSKARVRDQWAYTLWKLIPRNRKHCEHWGLYGNYDSVAEIDEVLKNPPLHRLNNRSTK